MKMKFSPEQVTGLLKQASFQWGIAGGWGIDLFLGDKTRNHTDVDVAVLRKDVEKVFSYLHEFDLQVVVNAGGLKPHSNFTDLTAGRHSVWVKDSSSEEFLFELLFNDSAKGMWLYRRDQQVKRILKETFITKGNKKIFAPEIILLYKSKSLHKIDEQDFTNTLKMLNNKQINWLRTSLLQVDPSHPWVSRLQYVL